jgi:L-glyceraldehyde 3-phosphate reductase
MALAWLLKDKRVTTVLIGVSSVEQLEDNLACLINPDFTGDELATIEGVLRGE